MYIMHHISINAHLVLEDGSVFAGAAVGAAGNVSAEACFTTTMAGYQEAITDPSYAGQALVFSYPLIGNYGISSHHSESDRAQARAVVMRQARPMFSDWLVDEGVVGLDHVDTRAVVRHIRNFGAMRCAVGPASPAELLEMARSEPHIDVDRAAGDDGMTMPPLALDVSTAEPYRVGSGPRVVVLDLGCKSSVIKSIALHGMEAVVVPGSYDAGAILDLAPSAVLIGNGPGDPRQLVAQIDTVRALLGRTPLFGICLGHQLIALALGMTTFKLPFGHRGVNHPVRDLATGRVLVTSQNHGFSVQGGDSSHVSHVSLNDDTVEGIRSDGFASVQFHPEAAPGPSDAFGFFEEMRTSCHSAPISAAS